MTKNTSEAFKCPIHHMAHESILCIIQPAFNVTKNPWILPCFKTEKMKAGLSFVSGHWPQRSR